jgi:hypothetical protein
VEEANADAMTGILKTLPELPDWKFEIDEISAGVYRVRGVDKDGRSVEATGTDEDALLEECRRSASGMQGQIPRR